MTRIKICGIRDQELASAAVEAGADAIGCVLAPGSPRSVSFNVARDIASSLPPEVEMVGVFVNGSLEEDLQPWQPRWTQLHGDEDEAMAAALDGPVIRALPFEEKLLRQWDACKSVARILVDSPNAGSGSSFDHDALEEIMESISTPIIVAGGLTIENVGEVIRRLHPWAVDVSSGVESSRGHKEPSMIREFCAAAREAGC